MAIDKMLLAGSSGMLILKLLSGGDMYGYQIAGELARLSDDTFKLKAGTLYPLLHSLEGKGFLTSYDDGTAGGKPRRYYRLTGRGKGELADRRAEWARYTFAVENVLKGGATNA